MAFPPGARGSARAARGRGSRPAGELRVGDELPALPVLRTGELLDVVPFVADEHVAISVDCDRDRGVELSRLVAQASPRSDELSRSGEFLDPVIAVIDDEHIPIAIDRAAHRTTQLPVSTPVGAPFV